MKEYQERVLHERSDLWIMLTKLNKFIESSEYTHLDSEDKRLLIRQTDSMKQYIDVLDERINRFKY